MTDLIERALSALRSAAINVRAAKGLSALGDIEEAQEAIRALSATQVGVERDANGEAMLCEGCGTSKTIAAILAQHGKAAISCCPERKMVEARFFWRQAQPTSPTAEVDVERETLRLIAAECDRFEGYATVEGLASNIKLLTDAALSNKGEPHA